MSPEIQNKLVKLLGFVVQAGIVLACVKLFPDRPEVLATIVSISATAYGAIGYNTPLEAVRKAKGLVSVRAPSEHDVNQMRDAINVADSVAPPAEQS